MTIIIINIKDTTLRCVHKSEMFHEMCNIHINTDVKMFYWKFATTCICWEVVSIFRVGPFFPGWEMNLVLWRSSL